MSTLPTFVTHVALGVSLYVSASSGIPTLPQDAGVGYDLGLEDTSMLLQSELAIRSSHELQPRSDARMLLLIVSCHKHAANWSSLHELGMSEPDASYLILAGRPPGEATMDAPYTVSLQDHTLFVDGSDEYDALPEKMVRAFTAVLEAPELQQFTHVLKLDDTTALEGTRNMSFRQMEDALPELPGDYFASEYGFHAVRCVEPKELYVREGMFSGGAQWAAPQIKNTSYWYDHPMLCNDTFTYASGEAGYIVSRHALGKIAQAWPLSSMARLAHTHVLEDWAIGLALFQAGTKLVPIHVPGEPMFWDLACGCQLPCNSPPTARQEEEARACPSEGCGTCCLGPCREVEGLCPDVVHVGAWECAAGKCNLSS